MRKKDNLLSDFICVIGESLKTNFDDGLRFVICDLGFVICDLGVGLQGKIYKNSNNGIN
jgi:hypothetical protein